MPAIPNHSGYLKARFNKIKFRPFSGSLNLETSNHVYILQNWLYSRASVLRTPEQVMLDEFLRSQCRLLEGVRIGY